MTAAVLPGISFAPREQFIRTVDCTSLAAPYLFNSGQGFNPSLYPRYVFEFQGVQAATDAVNFYVRMNGDSAAGAYGYDGWFDDEDGVASGLLSSNGATQILPFADLGNVAAAEQGLTGYVELMYPGSATLYPRVNYNLHGVNSNTHDYTVRGWGRRKTAAQITSLDFLFSSGNFLSGQIHIYGYRRQ